MKKAALLTLIIAASFISGFAFKAMLTGNDAPKSKKVTGIGGIFFKCKDPKKLKEWYKTNLGLQTDKYGTVFEWYQGADSTKKGFTQWSPFKETTTYFAKDFMINYRVAHLDALLAELKVNGVAITDTVVSESYGKFVHIMDPDSNKIELWEPNDVEFEKLGNQIGATTTK